MDKKLRKKLLWLTADFLLVALLIVLDQFSKRLAVLHLKGQGAFVLWKKVFELDYLENRGSAFGLFQNKKVFLLLVGFVFMGIILSFLIKLPNEKRYIPLHAAISFLLAGGVGNMIDRILQGYVVDFFSFVLIHFPVFNVADIYIVISAFALVFLLLLVYREEDLL